MVKFLVKTQDNACLSKNKIHSSKQLIRKLRLKKFNLYYFNNETRTPQISPSKSKLSKLNQILITFHIEMTLKHNQTCSNVLINPT